MSDEVKALKVRLQEAANKLLSARESTIKEHRKHLLQLRYAWMKAMRSRPRYMWSNLLNEYPDRLGLIQAACIVWWDFFGDQIPEQVREHPTYEYMQKWDNEHYVEKERTCRALSFLGYPRFLADKRVREYADPSKVDVGLFFDTLESFNK